MKKQIYSAFTLAEVLITLTILGVVAAITIPSIIRREQEKTTVTKVLKYYSAFSNILNNEMVTNPNVSKWENDYESTLSGGIDMSMVDPFVTLFKRNLKGATDYTGWAYSTKTIDGRDSTQPSGTSLNHGSRALVLNDGAVATFFGAVGRMPELMQAQEID